MLLVTKEHFNKQWHGGGGQTQAVTWGGGQDPSSDMGGGDPSRSLGGAAASFFRPSLLKTALVRAINDSLESSRDQSYTSIISL